MEMNLSEKVSLLPAASNDRATTSDESVVTPDIDNDFVILHQGGDWLTVEEVTTLENASARTIQRRISQGKYSKAVQIPSTKGGRGGKEWRIHADSLSEQARIRYYSQQVSAVCNLPANSPPQPPSLYKREGGRGVSSQREGGRGVSSQREGGRGVSSVPVNSAMREDGLNKANLVSRYIGFVKTTAERKGKKAAQDRFVELYNSQRLFPELFEKVGHVSVPTLNRWRTKLRRAGGNYDRIADTRGHCFRGKTKISHAESQILKACILFPNAPSVANAIRVASEIMRTRGITPASENTYRRWVEHWRSRNYHLWTLLRKGEKALNDECLPYITRDYDRIDVGDVLVGDGHTLNFDIMNPWTGREQRMTLIVWEDMKSAYPCGWEIMPTENTRSILSAFRRAVIQLGKLPRFIYIDNGRAFKSEYFQGSMNEVTGAFERLGVESIIAQPYHGQSKTVERFFGTLHELEQWVPTYRGNSIDNKPAYLSRNEKFHKKLHEKIMQGRCITLEMAHAAIAAWFDMYAARPSDGHRLRGRTPAEVFNAGRGAGIDVAELDFLLMEQKVRTVYQNGIKFMGEWYYDPVLFGRKHEVVIRYDLQDTSYLLVYEPDDLDHPICRAARTDEVHPVIRIGDAAEKQEYEDQMSQKNALKTVTLNSGRKLLEHIIMPEYKEKLSSGHLLPEDERTPDRRAKVIPMKLTKADMDQAITESDRIIAEMRAEEEKNRIPAFEVPDFAEAEAVFHALSMPEQYKIALHYFTLKGEVPSAWTSVMAYFEKTQEYKNQADQWELYQRNLITEKYRVG